MANDMITELDRLHHRATDMRARERQLADAGENDPATDAWKIASILAASAESEFEIALVEAWPAVARLLREAEQWRTRESETQEALQAIGEEFGVRGGEPRVDGIRRVLTEQRDQLAALLREAGEGWRPKHGDRVEWISTGYKGVIAGDEIRTFDVKVHGGGRVFLPIHALRPLPAPPAAGAPDAED